MKVYISWQTYLRHGNRCYNTGYWATEALAKQEMDRLEKQRLASVGTEHEIGWYGYDSIPLRSQ